LADEYATDAGGLLSGTGKNVGDATAQDQLVKDIGEKGSVCENNNNIMSGGSMVRKQHYATFGYALGKLTAMSTSDWKIK
jgi:hypothetical protein